MQVRLGLSYCISEVFPVFRYNFQDALFDAQKTNFHTTVNLLWYVELTLDDVLVL